jgi:hypothetical protein
MARRLNQGSLSSQSTARLRVNYNLEKAPMLSDNEGGESAGGRREDGFFAPGYWKRLSGPVMLGVLLVALCLLVLVMLPLVSLFQATVERWQQ